MPDGFIDTDFVAVDSGDCQETYDDVIPWGKKLTT